MRFKKIISGIFVLSVIAMGSPLIALGHYPPHVGKYYTPCVAPSDPVECEVASYPFRVHISNMEGRWVGIDEGYSTLGLFTTLPFFENCNYEPFIDLRGHYLNDGRKAANAGTGVRYWNSQKRSVIGFNTYYDYREGKWHSYQQIGAGAEYLSMRGDFRINGYLPIGKRERHSSTKIFDDFEGNFFATCREQRPAMWGIDGEFGRWLKRKEPCDFLDIYGAVGGHYFFSKTHHMHAYGGELRVAANVGRYFSFELKAGYDSVFNAIVQGRVALTFPIDNTYFSGLCNTSSACATSSECLVRELTLQSVHRQELIAVDDEECCWSWNWDSRPQ